MSRDKLFNLVQYNTSMLAMEYIFFVIISWCARLMSARLMGTNIGTYVRRTYLIQLTTLTFLPSQFSCPTAQAGAHQAEDDECIRNHDIHLYMPRGDCITDSRGILIYVH